MKIVYLLYCDLSRHDGVAKKMETQRQKWKILEHTREIFCFIQEIKQPVFKINRYFFKHPLRDRLKSDSAFLDDTAAFRLDITYTLHDFFGRTLSNLLNKPVPERIFALNVKLVNIIQWEKIFIKRGQA